MTAEPPAWASGGVAWLVIAAGEDREHAGNAGYDDVPAEHYSWDSTVAHHAAVQVGDAIVLWDKETSLGVSVIEHIDIEEDVPKTLFRCPACQSAAIKARKGLKPRFRCPDCKHTFESPVNVTKAVTTYRSRHSAGWTDLDGLFTAEELRSMCLSPKTQQSLRRLDWPLFVHAVSAKTSLGKLTNLRFTAARINGGHTEATVRVRVGQGAFRKALLNLYGPTCAFSGPAPPAALEAAHLYSYAKEAAHHLHGGLLLRRDLHRLFDEGQLAVEPDAGTVDVSPELMQFDGYAALHGVDVKVTLSAPVRNWLREHWHEHRLST